MRLAHWAGFGREDATADQEEGLVSVLLWSSSPSSVEGKNLVDYQSVVVLKDWMLFLQHRVINKSHVKINPFRRTLVISPSL